MEQWLNAGCYGVMVAAAAWAVTRPRLLDAAWRGRTWNAALVGLALLLALPLLSWLPEAPAPHLAGGDVPVAARGPAALIRLPRLDALVPLGLLASVWAVGVLGRLAWLALSVRHVRALRATALPFPPAREARLSRWTRESAGRAVLAVSHRVPGATMLGYGRPIVAVPADWLTRLDEEELDAILLHELAHAERRDDLAQLAQHVLVAVCWLHPAAWWIVRRIEFEREAACDERAARATTARGYARCLVKVAEAVQAPPAASPMLAASALGRRPGLSRRVDLLLAAPRWASRGRSRLAGAVAVSALSVLVARAQSLPPVFSVNAEDRQATAGSGGRLPPRPSERPGAGVADSGAAPSRPTQGAPRRRAGAASAPRQAAIVEAAADHTRPLSSADEPVPANSVPAGPLGDVVVPTQVSPAPGLPAIAHRAGLPSPVVAPPDAVPSPRGDAPRGVSTPYRTLATLGRAGKRTGAWFARTGTAIADGVTSW